jgi:hypothetical protein
VYALAQDANGSAIPTPSDGSLGAFDSTRVSGENENERSIPFLSIRSARVSGPAVVPRGEVSRSTSGTYWIGLSGINPWSYSRFYSGIFSIGKRGTSVIFNGLGRV